MKVSGAEMQKNLVQLVKDTTDMGNAYHRLTSLYGELNKSYDKLLFNNEKLLAGNRNPQAYWRIEFYPR